MGVIFHGTLVTGLVYNGRVIRGAAYRGRYVYGNHDIFRFSPRSLSFDYDAYMSEQAFTVNAHNDWYIEELL